MIHTYRAKVCNK